jgi:hypothetical protein
LCKIPQQRRPQPHRSASLSLVKCLGKLHMYTFKTCRDIQYPLWEKSGYFMDSQGIAVRFPTEPRDFSTIVRAQAGYGEHTHAFSMTIAGFLLAYKAAGAWSWWLNLVHCSARECSEIYFKSPTLLRGLYLNVAVLIHHLWWLRSGKRHRLRIRVWRILNFKGRRNFSPPRQFLLSSELVLS